MQPEQLHELMSTPNEELQTKLLTFLGLEYITLQELICNNQFPIKVSDEILKNIAWAYYSGFKVRPLGAREEALVQNPKNTFLISKHLAEKNNELGKSSYASCFLWGIGVSQEIPHALKLFQVCKNAEYYLGICHQELQSFSRALEYFSLVQDPHNQYPDLQTRIKVCRYQQELVALYKKLEDTSTQLEDHRRTQEEASGIEESLAQLTLAGSPLASTSPPPALPLLATDTRMGWFYLSEWMDGFNSESRSELRANAHEELKLKKQAHVTQENRYKQLEEEQHNNAITLNLPHDDRVRLNESKKLLVLEFNTLSNEINYLEDLLKKDFAHEKLLKRQLETEITFFKATRTKTSQTKDKALELQKSLLNPAEITSSTIQVASIPTRRLITAEQSVLQASLQVLEAHQRPYISFQPDQLGWASDPTATEQRMSSDNNEYSVFYSYLQGVKLGNTEINYRQKTNPHANHLGDYDMALLGTYTNIIKVINELIYHEDEKQQVDNEQRLAKLMLEFSRSTKEVSLLDLQLINPNITKGQVDSINRILYHCFVKEITRRAFSQDKMRQLPWASAHARAVQLIAAGHLRMEDVFSNRSKLYPLSDKVGSDYGIFTGRDIGLDGIFEKTKEKIDRINSLYTKKILKFQPTHHVQGLQFFNQYPKGKLVPSRKQFRKELQETYGGEYDSDGEGYESEEEAFSKLSI